MRKPAQPQTDVTEALTTPEKPTPETGAASYSREQLEPLFEHSANAMVIIDDQYHIIDANGISCDKLGWTRATIIGQHCSKVLGCMNLNRMTLCGTSSCPLTQVLQKNAPIPNEELICGAPEGHTDEYAVGITPIKAENRRIVVFSAREVSSLKVANRVRSNFVSMVSHELRTP